MKAILIKSVKVILITFLVVIITTMCVFALIPMIHTYREASSFRSKTSPLTQETIQDLCAKLSLPVTDRRCNGKSSVYAPEFFDDILKKLRPDDGRVVTFDEVNEWLGKYQFRRGPNSIQSDGIEYFVVYYDLQGDHVFPIVISFFADGRLWRVVASTVSD